MANVVISFHNQLLFHNKNARAPFYQAFIDGLQAAGNNLLIFENMHFMKNEKSEIPKAYLDKIYGFNPDFFIFFNNQFWDISKHFDLPIIIYDVDSPNVFNNVDLLKNNPRYKYITNQTDGIEILSEAFNCDRKNIVYIPPFTNIQPEDIEQNINISFCGSPWLFDDFNDFNIFTANNPTPMDRKNAITVLEAFKENPQKSLEEIYSDLNILHEKSYLKFENQQIVAARLAGSMRCKILSEIYDLGLEIRGVCWDGPIVKAFPELQLVYNREDVYDTITTQDFYNRSKIGFNTKHLQAKSGFSWRVCDILASNACLISEKASDLKTLGFDIPQYESAAEARELCKKILDNENLRKDIVAHSHEIIEKNHRVEQIIPFMEDFIGLKLVSDTKGFINIIQNIDKKDDFPCIDKKKLKFKQRLYYKLSKYFYKKI